MNQTLVQYFKTSYVEVYRAAGAAEKIRTPISKHLMLKFIWFAPGNTLIRREFQNILC